MKEKNETIPLLAEAVKTLLSFAPWKFAILYAGSLLGALSNAVGALMIIPLAQLAGVDFQTQSVTSPWGFITPIVDWINKIEFTQSLSSILWVYATLSILIAAMAYGRTLMGARLSMNFTKHIRMKLYNSILSAKWEYLAAGRLSVFMNRLSGQANAMQGVANQVIGVIHQIVGMIISIGIMLALNWKFTLMTILCGIVVAIVVFPVRWSVRDAGERQLVNTQRIFQMLAEHIGSLKMIKSSGLEWDFQQKLRSVSEELEAQSLRMTRASAIISFTNRTAMAMGFCVMLYYAVTWLKVPLANFFLLLLIMGRIMPQVAGLQSSIQGLNFSLPAYKDIMQTFADCEAMRESHLDDDKSVLGLSHQIEFKDVQFKYPKSDRVIIDQLNLVVQANETLALVGPSGVGKTTVADMLAGLMTPTHGSMLVDGKYLQGELLGQWRRSIAYVTQETYLFNDTIRNNIEWIKSGVTDAEIWQCLESAAIRECIERLPNGLDSSIGERGVRLSGGERQRLALARALLAKPDLLILDEATSALDNENEKLIHQALMNIHGTLTVVIIAHRETTIRHADKVLYLGEPKPKILNMEDYSRSIIIG